MYRAAILVALLGLVVAAPAAAAEPELGGRITALHFPIRWELDPHTFTVTNQSTIAARVTLEATADDGSAAGWFVDSEAFTLAVDESREVTITAAGPEATILTATLRGEGMTGTDVGALALEVGLRHAEWYEQAAGWLAPAFLLAFLLVLVVILRLSRRRW